MDADPASYGALLSATLPDAGAASDPAMLAAQLLAVLLLGALAYYSGLNRLWEPLARRASHTAGFLRDLSRSPLGATNSSSRRRRARTDATVAPVPSVSDLHHVTAREVMTSRVDVTALPVTATLDDALSLVRTSGHSRLPLFDEHLDTILGVVYAKDLFTYIRPGMNTSTVTRVDWAKLARPALFVPHGKPLDELLREFQTRKIHVAVVVDEYGGTAGLVTMEDILEELVGDIQDEHDDREDVLHERLGPSTFRVDARINLDDLNELLGVRIDTEQFDFETLGGLLFHLTGSIPEAGAEITYEGLQLRVESMDAQRIGHVLIRLTEQEERTEETVHPVVQAVSRAVVLPVALGLEAAAQLFRFLR